VTVATKKNNWPEYQFKPLENETTCEEGEIFLQEMISDWAKLCKRFSLQGEVDYLDIRRCQFYASQVIERFPELKHKYLYHHYDDALSNYLGVEYAIKTDKRAQDELGYKSLIFEHKPYYLFPVE
jgi:hypothetical protein